jgi:phage baseplate assembly protein W
MRDIIEGPPGEHEAPPSWRSRLIWFVGLAIAGTTATAIVAYALRALLKL